MVDPDRWRPTTVPSRRVLGAIVYFFSSTAMKNKRERYGLLTYQNSASGPV